MTRNSPLVRRLLVVLAASGLLGAAFLASSQSALGVVITPCSSVDLSESPSQFDTPPQGVVLTATSTGCTSPEYQFYLQPPGGAWAAQGSYSSVATFNWNTTGRALGIWGIGVHARAIGKTAPYDVYYVGTYNLAVAHCQSVDLVPAVSEPQPPGGVVVFNASSTNCPSPYYRFLVLPPGGTWTSQGPYGTSATFVWTTTGLKPGTWTIGVWARDRGSKASYDAFGLFTFRLSAPQKCIWVSMAPSAPSPVPPGTSVNFGLAASSGCNNVVAEFLRLAPGGVWTITQQYSATFSWTWDTTNFLPGRYEIQVRTKAATSTATYDTYVITTYYLGT